MTIKPSEKYVDQCAQHVIAFNIMVSVCEILMRLIDEDELKARVNIGKQKYKMKLFLQALKHAKGAAEQYSEEFLYNNIYGNDEFLSCNLDLARLFLLLFDRLYAEEKNYNETLCKVQEFISKLPSKGLINSNTITKCKLI